MMTPKSPFEINWPLEWLAGSSQHILTFLWTKCKQLFQFLAADSKKFALFNVKNGKYLGQINIPAHLERSKGKDEKHCMFEQTGLSLFIFDEDKLIAVHDYERSFPAVLDIYKFW